MSARSVRVVKNFFKSVPKMHKAALASGFSSKGGSHSHWNKVTLIPGDGIGPEIAQSVKTIFKAAKAPIKWETVCHKPVKNEKGELTIPSAVISSIRKNKVGLKGPLMTPVGNGFKSLNLAIRKELDLFANVRPCKNVQGVHTPFGDVDLVVVRENTEGEYCGIEHSLLSDGSVATAVRLITRHASERVAEYAFKHALKNDRSRVTAVHLTDEMPRSDGLFLKCCYDMSKMFPSVDFEAANLADVAHDMAYEPWNFDVIVAPNLYGDILSDLAAGLIGGLGLTPSANMGKDLAVFESVHGTAPDIAGQDKANPTALLLSAVMMLRHLDLPVQADRISEACLSTIAEGKVTTCDLGGEASCSQFTEEICRKLNLIDTTGETISEKPEENDE